MMSPAFFTSVRGHVNDVGGCAPGGYNTIARDLAGRFPCSAGGLRSRGEQVDDSRSDPLQYPHQRRHHRRPQCDGRWLIIGETRLLGVVAKYGSNAVIRSVEYILTTAKTGCARKIEMARRDLSRAQHLDHDLPAAAKCRSRRPSRSGLRSEDRSRGHASQVPGSSTASPPTRYRHLQSLVALCPDIPVNSAISGR